MDSELSTKLDNCIQIAQDFTRLYYLTFDKRRHQIARLFLETATFVWNGNGSQGAEQIQKFFLELPESEHTVTSLDGQPIVDDAVSGQPSHLIHVGGTVKYTDLPTQPFQQSFIITVLAEKWKIVSDCYRLQDYLVKQSE